MAARRPGSAAAAINIALGLLAAATAAAAAAAPACAGGAAAARAACEASEWCAAQLHTATWQFEQVHACACAGQPAGASLAAAVAAARESQLLPLCGNGQSLSADEDSGEAGCAATVCHCDRGAGGVYTWTAAEHTCDFAPTDALTPTLSLAITLVVIGQFLQLALTGVSAHA
jgi:hypothetical protein